jgi:hypothetical protein
MVFMGDVSCSIAVLPVCVYGRIVCMKILHVRFGVLRSMIVCMLMMVAQYVCCCLFDVQGNRWNGSD